MKVDMLQIRKTTTMHTGANLNRSERWRYYFCQAKHYLRRPPFTVDAMLCKTWWTEVDQFCRCKDVIKVSLRHYRLSHICKQLTTIDRGHCSGYADKIAAYHKW